MTSTTERPTPNLNPPDDSSLVGPPRTELTGERISLSGWGSVLAEAIRSAKLRRWHEARPWQTNAALLLIGAGLLLLSRQLVSEYSRLTLGFSGVSGWSAWLYVAAVFLILTQPVDRYTFPIILVVAIACRLIPLFAQPYMSSDIYRYVWDGIVQHAHISPYRYVPGNPVLRFLREPNQEIFDNINRRDYAHTIYPPVAQALFYCITFISATVGAMKTAMVLFEGLTLYALVQILRAMGLRREQALLYAWCPLLVWEIAGSGHLDSAAMAFISLALLFRLRRQPILTGLFLGLAVATKLYPIVLLPALMMRRGQKSETARDNRVPHSSRLHAMGGVNIFQLDWQLPATTFAVIALGYATYSSVGKLVFGFLGGYVQEEGITTGTRYFLLELAQHIPGLHNLPSEAFYLLCALTFSAPSPSGPSTSPRRKTTLNPEILAQATPGFLAPAFALAAALMLLFSPHYPWYIVWLIPFFTLQPNLPILHLPDGLLLSLYDTTRRRLTAPPNMFLLNKILYGALFAATLIYLALRNRTLRRSKLPSSSA